VKRAGTAADRLQARLPQIASIVLSTGIAAQLALAMVGGRGAPFNTPTAATPLVSQQVAAPLDILKLQQAHLFGEAAPVADGEVAVPAESAFEVKGLVAFNDVRMGMAILKDSVSGASHLYQVGASLGGDARLLEVKTDRIVVQRGGGLLALLMPHLGAGASAGSATSAWLAMTGSDAPAADYDLATEPETARQKTVEPPLASGG
jgi:type II secretory pathway component PulC